MQRKTRDYIVHLDLEHCGEAGGADGVRVSTPAKMAALLFRPR